jgi:hypothetical protein
MMTVLRNPPNQSGLQRYPLPLWDINMPRKTDRKLLEWLHEEPSLKQNLLKLVTS